MIKEFFHDTTTGDITSLFLILISSILCSVGGVCGGMFNVPIAIYVIGFNTMESMPFSCSLIFGLNFVKLLLSFAESEFRNRRQILFDLDIAAIFAPMTVIGSTFGIIFNQIFPQMFTLILFGLSILPFSIMLTKKAISLYNQEEVNNCCTVQPNPIPYHKTYPVLWDRLVVIIGQSLLIFLFSILKKPDFILDLDPCSNTWWLLTLAIIPFAIIAQIFMLSRIQIQQIESLKNTHNENLIMRNNQLYKDRLIINSDHYLRIVLIGLTIGLSSGLFGIGGCLFTGSYLVTQNFNPRISSFTTGFMTMYSSFISLLQLIIMDRINYSYSLMGLLPVLIGTFIGIKIIMHLINQKQKLSYIVFILATILIATIIIIFTEQIINIVKAADSNKKIFVFDPSNVCR